MKKSLRISCIVLLTVLILTGNTVFSVAATEEEAVELREILTVQDEKHAEYADRLNDGVYSSYVSYKKAESVTVSGDQEIGYAYIGWQKIPTSVKIAWLDRDKKALSEAELSPALWNEYYAAPQDGVCGFTLTFKEECAISEISAFTAGELAEELPRFEAPLKEPAVMLIVAYPGEACRPISIVWIPAW